ncbi:MAG: nitrogen fixation protein NifH [Actinobacteria bacterium]|nr:MAG: nitrogen fixation protein NifH [Actinomycetota bacterium]
MSVKEWLLEENNPTVRYLALTELCDVSPDEKQAIEAKKEIMEKGVVPKILAKQAEGGYFDEPDKFYTAKYKGTVWQLIILAELLADPNDERIKKACEFILTNSQDKESGGFSMHRSAKKGGGRHSEVITCLTSNMVFSLIRLGYLSDSRVQHGIDWITKYQRFDDMVANPPKDWPYDRYEMCWGKHTCHMGVAKALKALAEIPANKRSAQVKRAIDNGVEYLLLHHIHKRSHDLTKTSRPGWRRFSFPSMYQTDILEILCILNKLGIKDERMQEAIDLVAAKKLDSGQWHLATTFNGRFQTNIEVKGKPSKWITLRALIVLKAYS